MKTIAGMRKMEECSVPTKAQIRAWVKELRSGKYQQTEQALQNQYGFCCLGVACMRFIPKKNRNLDSNGFLIGQMPTPDEGQRNVPAWLQSIDSLFDELTEVNLAKLNDSGPPFAITTELLSDFNFDEIADLLELVFIHEILEEE